MEIQRICLLVVIFGALLSCQTKDTPQSDTLTVKLDNSVRMEERRARMAEMREFLWRHWINRSSAILFLTSVSKEGKTTHSEYRVLLIPGNSHMLKVAFVRDRIGYQGQVIPKPDGGYEAYTVDRILSKNPYGIAADAKITVLPSDAVAYSTNYWLRFKGWNDTFVTYF